MGLIIRTAGAKRTKLEIKRDYEYLMRAWENIREKTMHSIAPALIYGEEDLVKRAIRDMYDKDIEAIIVEGDPGDTVHIVGSGTAVVTVHGDSRPDLGPGDTFGEIALLRDTPRTATVRAADDLTTYSLEREDFLTAIQGSSASAEALAEVRLRRDASS